MPNTLLSGLVGRQEVHAQRSINQSAIANPHLHATGKSHLSLCQLFICASVVILLCT